MKLFFFSILILKLNFIELLTPIIIEPFQKYQIKQKKEILFQYENIIKNPDILTDIIIYYKREKDSIQDDLTFFIVKNINDIYINTTDSKIKQKLYKGFFTKQSFYQSEIRQSKNYTINTGNGTYYIFLSGYITGEFEIFNLQNIKKINPYYSFNVNYRSFYSNKNVTLSLGKINENIKLQYQINSGNLSLIEENKNFNNIQILNNNNKIGFFDLKKGNNYSLLFNLGEIKGNLFGNFYKEELEILNIGNSIEKMGQNFNVDLIINMTDINNTYLQIETNDDFEIYYQYYNTINKEEIIKNYPKKREDFLYNINKTKYENIEKFTKDSNENLCMLIRVYFQTKIFIKNLPQPNLLINDKKEKIKKDTLYFYLLNSSLLLNEKKNECLIYITEPSGININSNNSLLNKLKNYPRKLYKIDLESDIKIILYHKEKDFNFEIKFYSQIEDYGKTDKIIHETEFFIEKRIELNDCNKNYYFFYFTYSNFTTYTKLIKGNANVYSINEYDDNINLDDIYPMNNDKEIELLEEQKEQKENFLVLKLKCISKSIVDIYSIKDDFMNHFSTSSTKYLYIRENEYVNISLKYNIQLDLIFDKKQNEQNILVKLNETKYNLNKNNLYYQIENINPIYTNSLEIISIKGNNIIILRGGVIESNSIIVYDTLKYKYSMYNIFVYPKDDKSIKEVKITSKLLNSGDFILFFLYNNYGRKPFFDISFFDAEKLISTYNSNFNITIKNPYDDLNNRKLDDNEYYYYYIFGNDKNKALWFTYEITRNIKLDSDSLQIMKKGINTFSIDTKNKKQLIYQINKCQNKNVEITLKENKLIKKYKLKNNFKYDKNKFIISEYKIDKENNISLEIKSFNNTLFKYITLEKEIKYTFNPTQNYNITINIDNSTNKVKLNFESFLQNEKTEYMIIIVNQSDVNETFMNDECYLFDILEKEKTKIIKFDDDGFNKNIEKEFYFEFKEEKYFLNIFAKQKDNFKIITIYNYTELYHIKTDNKNSFLFYFLLILGILILISIGIGIYIYYKKKENKKQQLVNTIDSVDQI